MIISMKLIWLIIDLAKIFKEKPGKSFGLKFIPNQLDLFRFTPKICIGTNRNSSKSIQKKFSISFDANRLKIYHT